MYTRYIPQSDGTYRRSRVPDRTPQPPRQEPAPCPPPEPECPPQEPKPLRPQCPRREGAPRREPRPSQRESKQETGIPGFLRQLLPRDFDTGDLLVVILLLLMAGDCGEDQNTALLTLVLYLFL